ncbi:MAG: Spy/CpxP family protein refolding chaperone [Thermoguttaceae bacterium]
MKKPFPLLRFEEVQKELGLNGEQQENIKKLLDESLAASQVRIPNFKSLTEEERKEKLQEAKKEFAEKMVGFEKRLAEILTTNQQARLSQLRLQLNLQLKGAAMFGSTGMAKVLKLTDDQREQIKDINKDTHEKLQKLIESIKSLPKEERSAKMAEMRDEGIQVIKDSLQKAVEVLKPEQQQKFEKLKGKKFDVDWAALLAQQPQETPATGRID